MNSLAHRFVAPTRNLVADPRSQFLAIGKGFMPTAAANVQQSVGNGFTMLPEPQDRGAVVKQQPVSVASFEEKIFNTLVSLKVSASVFAMHLTAAERQRLFGELDDVINADDWHEGDNLPTKESFQQFLKWMIYSGSVDWTSIGVSDAGTVLVAWRKPRVLLTADFDGKDGVRWTVKLSGDDGEVGHTAGRCSLKLFAEQSQFYLHR